MTPTEAAYILIEYNRWRRGDEKIEMPSPKIIGQAIDISIDILLKHIKSKPYEAPATSKPRQRRKAG